MPTEGLRGRCALQAEDADRAAERAQAAQGQRAEALSRLQDVHRQKARQLKDSVEAVQQVGSCPWKRLNVIPLLRPELQWHSLASTQACARKARFRGPADMHAVNSIPHVEMSRRCSCSELRPAHRQM